MADIKSIATATAPREFELSYSTTVEEVYEKLSARASAFKMPFKIKEGIPGKRISFEKEPNLDVTIWVFVKDGNKIKVMANIQENKTTVNGMRVDKNSVMQKGIKGVANLPIERGEYLDEVTEKVKKILNGEQVEDYVTPVGANGSGQTEKNWLVALLLCLFLGGIGAHRFYAGKVGSGILYILTVGIFGIGVLVDLIKIITGKFTDKEGNPIQKNKN